MPNTIVVSGGSLLKGALSVPPSKSHTLRAILLAAFAKGKSFIYHPLASPDTDAMCCACELLGATIHKLPSHIEITGNGGTIPPVDGIIDAGNSGLVLRLCTGLAALSNQPIVVTGDHSIRHRRPMAPLLSALRQLGVEVRTTKGDERAPLIVQGPLLHQRASLEGEDSQAISALLLLGTLAPFPLTIEVLNPGEKPWIDMTLYWLRKLHLPYEHRDYTWYRTQGSGSYQGFSYHVPGDFSSAAFLMAASLLTHSPLTLHGLDMQDPQGDKIVLSHFCSMGAEYTYCAQTQTLQLYPHPTLQGLAINMNDCIDALPILAVVACFATTPTTLYGAAAAKHKESNRLLAITQELQKMGGVIHPSSDGLTIYPSRLQGATVYSHEDHRIALALAVGALALSSPTTITATSCIRKTFPSFVEDLSGIGANIQAYP